MLVRELEMEALLLLPLISCLSREHYNAVAESQTSSFGGLAHLSCNHSSAQWHSSGAGLNSGC